MDIGKADFDMLYEKYVDSVYKTALYYSGSHHAAEEITQTVFMKLHVHKESVNKDKVRSWLLTTAKHTGMKENRRRKREILIEDVVYEESGMIENIEHSVIDKIHIEEYKALTEEILADLQMYHPRWYEAVTVTYLLEKPQKEVADSMGITLEGLHSMLYRAKKWIKDRYERRFDEIRKE